MSRLFAVIICSIFIASGSLSLMSCVYHPDVQQGNIITDQDIKAMHSGMTRDEVRSLLGDPLLENIYTDNTMIYVYTFKHQYHALQETRLIVYLRNERVTHFWVEKQSPFSPITLPKPHPTSRTHKNT